MLRRCPAPLTVLTAGLALGLGWLPSPSRADGLTAGSNTSNTQTVLLDYTLTTTQAIAPQPGTPSTTGSSSTTTPQVLALDSPISIVPPPSTSSTGPLQIVKPTDGYYYNNPNELLVGVGNTTLNGSPVQALGLTFYGKGLGAGDSLTFSLPFSSAIVNGNPPQIPQFTVVDPTTLQPISSIQIKYIGKDSSSGSSSSTSSGTGSGNGNGNGNGSTGTVAFAPEPLSILLWSGLAGLGVWRTRRNGRLGRQASR